jgi:precorrin-2 dehydrogenase/sirohydrochlorin ferrochelatase
MLPLTLTLRDWTVFILGRGPAAVRRLDQVRDAGAGNIRVFSPGADPQVAQAAGDMLTNRWPDEGEWRAARLAFIAGEDEAQSRALAEAARAARVLVNVEDMPALCDFYVPSLVRRGDLLLTVATGGQSPGLCQAIRQDLEGRYGPEWADRLKEMATRRQDWRTAGHDLKAVAAKTKQYLLEKGWLQ